MLIKTITNCPLKEGISFYTNLECASDILVSNDAGRNNIHSVIATENALSQLETSSFDLVFSLLSYGHHYPVSTYLKKIKLLLVQGGVLILDLRVIDGVTQGLRELERNGFSCEIFRHRRRGKSVKCVLGSIQSRQVDNSLLRSRVLLQSHRVITLGGCRVIFWAV